MISLTKAAISTDTNKWLASWGDRKGKSNRSFKILIFPSQQLPPMTVIYMANRQYYVYKTILGRENLNNFCQPSKGAGVGSDPGILFPFILSDGILPRCLAMEQHKVPSEVSSQGTQTCGGHDHPSVTAWILQQQGCPSLCNKGKYHQAEKQGSQASSPSSSIPCHTLDPSAEDNLQRAPYLPHRGRSHPQTTCWPPQHQPEHLLILCPP